MKIQKKDSEKDGLKEEEKKGKPKKRFPNGKNFETKFLY